MPRRSALPSKPVRRQHAIGPAIREVGVKRLASHAIIRSPPGPGCRPTRTMPTVFVLNGPNLNLLGTREPGVYGAQTLADVEALCRDAAAAHGWGVDFRQSNHEGALVDWIHEAARSHAAGEVTGVVLNAGAYTHTSVALHDAMKGVAVPVVEVHLSNVHAREPFRQHSYLSPAAAGIVVGFGANGYVLAIEGLARREAPRSTGAKGKGKKAKR
jgi:3-dehydroquinate dehydratase-2